MMRFNTKFVHTSEMFIDVCLQTPTRLSSSGCSALDDVVVLTNLSKHLPIRYKNFVSLVKGNVVRLHTHRTLIRKEQSQASSSGGSGGRGGGKHFFDITNRTVSEANVLLVLRARRRLFWIIVWGILAFFS